MGAEVIARPSRGSRGVWAPGAITDGAKRVKGPRCARRSPGTSLINELRACKAARKPLNKPSASLVRVILKDVFTYIRLVPCLVPSYGADLNCFGFQPLAQLPLILCRPCSVYDLRAVHLLQCLESGWLEAASPPQWVSVFTVCIH